jgi:hypothetical protein
MLSRSGIIGNARNLKSVLQVETEFVYTTTERNIILRDTDVTGNTPALIVGWGQYEVINCYPKYLVREQVKLCG